MMAVELCGASGAFAHPHTNEEQDHAHDQRHADPTSRAHEDNCPNSQPKCAIASTTFAQPFLLISRWNFLVDEPDSNDPPGSR